VLTRLRLDAALYEPPPPNSGKGRPRKKWKRLPTLAKLLKDEQTTWQAITIPWYNQPQPDIEIHTGTAFWFHFDLPGVHIRDVLIRDVAGKFDPQALLSTDLTLTAEQILTFFLRRWQMEPTFRHVCEQLGVETQRQWSDKAIARSTPALPGLFSLVTLLANTLFLRQEPRLRQAAWYTKTLPTFSEALAALRARLWAYFTFQISADEPHMVKVPRAILERLNDLWCYAA
jgi:hypothetical protein